MRLKTPLPIVVAREGDWFVTSCPRLQLATQGKTEREARENLADLIRECRSDPDTNKASL